MTDRTVLSLTGADAVPFLQDLASNDVTGPNLTYAALLTPQGKYLADFFVLNRDGTVWLDVAADLAQPLAQRLSMYRLRRDVTIAAADVAVARGSGPAPDGAHADPRHPALGWRAYDTDLPADDGTDWDALRVTHLVPESGIELLPNDSYPLEMGLDRLNGIDFRKGCYVGQEVTARMKHKTALKKGLTRVLIEGAAAAGTPITAGDRPAGTLHTRSGDRALAWLRFDRAEGEMQAGPATLRRDPTAD
ncbi:folate-binding protein [Rhodobacteraceae bacterium CCMM004]|nr:folate-binding protein [Rhodobacteraceae bacterium CCMM004]